jgi:hypothetical protein
VELSLTHLKVIVIAFVTKPNGLEKKAQLVIQSKSRVIKLIFLILAGYIEHHDRSNQVIYKET